MLEQQRKISANANAHLNYTNYTHPHVAISVCSLLFYCFANSFHAHRGSKTKPESETDPKTVIETKSGGVESIANWNDSHKDCVATLEAQMAQPRWVKVSEYPGQSEAKATKLNVLVYIVASQR